MEDFSRTFQGLFKFFPGLFQKKIKQFIPILRKMFIGKQYLYYQSNENMYKLCNKNLKNTSIANLKETKLKRINLKKLT